MVVIDDEGVILAFGSTAETMFGYAADDAIGKNVSILMAKPHVDRHDEYMRRYRETGERRMIGRRRVESARHRDGHVFPVEISIAEVHVAGRRCFVGFIQAMQKRGDDKEIFARLEELAHSMRISAMGAFATSIAHELNQPLTSIANYTEGLRDLLAKQGDLDGRDEIIGILDTCSKQAIRAGNLIHRLKDFVRGRSPHVERMKVETLVDEATKLALINGFKHKVHIETEFPDDLPQVRVDPLQGEQVLFNLMRNAFDAMENEQGGDHRVAIRGRKVEGGLVEITIADSGPGIMPELVDTLFDPFTTSKGSGMGVGLAICRQIIEAHGGAIWADEDSELGGAAFHFTLPVASEGNFHGE